MALSRSLFKRVLDGNRWDARIYDYFVQRRYGPYLGNKPPGERIEAGEPGEVHGPPKGGAQTSTNESLGVCLSQFSFLTILKSKFPQSVDFGDLHTSPT